MFQKVNSLWESHFPLLKVKKGMTEVKMVEWHHWLNGYVFDQATGDGEGQGSLACCSPWGPKKSDMTEGTNNNKD